MSSLDTLRPSIAFSTLACPEWAPDEVVARAAAFGYDAIEWRGGPEGHVSPSWSARQRAELRSRTAAAGVGALAVTSYAAFVSPDAAVRAANIADLVAHLELAADLGAPFVRAFAGEREDDAPSATLRGRARDALLLAAETAATLGVDIVVEPHDDHVRAELVAELLAAVDHPRVGCLWDPVNAWEAGEDPEVGAALLGPWIRYAQLKDAAGTGSTWRLTPIGEGEVPLLAGLRALSRRGPLPPLCVEWERAWHPELTPAADALGPALIAVRALARAVASMKLDSDPEPAA